MNTIASHLLFSRSPHQSVAHIPARSHMLFKALRQAECGNLTIIAPDGRQFVFTGTKPGPYARMCVYDWKALDELVIRGDIGLAETYIDHLWETDDLPALLTYGLMNGKSLEQFYHGKPWHVLWLRLRYWLSGNSLRGSRRNIMAHYDLGNRFYAHWLDKSLTYSGALFEGDASRTLDEAQQAKYQRVLSKLDAAPGAHILEIGCGWGGFAEAAARKGYRVTGLTLSKEQADYAKGRMRERGLDHLVDIRLADYRDITGIFDHIVSIGMFEHVGQEYWPAYFNVLSKHLAPEGRVMIQSITLDDALFDRLHGVTGFIEHYIFPGGFLPSRRAFCSAAEKSGLQCQQQYIFGRDYETTLKHWLRRFETNRVALRNEGFGEDFLRLWRFYLSICIASFASGRSSLMQVLLVHKADTVQMPVNQMPVKMAA